MEDHSIASAEYWRNSLTDAELGSGRFWQDGTNDLRRFENRHLRAGRLGQELVDQLFEDEPKNASSVLVVIRPKVYLNRLEHGAPRRAGTPDVVTPLVARAEITRDGVFRPHSGAYIPRDLLDPLERGSFVIGTVFDQDEFLTRKSMSAAGTADASRQEKPDLNRGWSTYLSDCQHLFEYVAKGWPTSEDRFELADYSFISKDAPGKGIRRHVIGLYDHIRRNGPSASLFERYACANDLTTEPCLPTNSAFSERLGHCSDEFSLAPSQRNALTHILRAEPAEILAVNGPPGTGKTTLILSVVASLWAARALEAGDPPVIFAASSNNQAVTNIIDSFGKDFSSGTGAFGGRWLPEIRSFGAYFASSENEKKQKDQYLTRDFFSAIESEEYFEKAKKEYLRAAKQAFSGFRSKELTIVEVVSLLRNRIKEESEKLKEIERSWSALLSARLTVARELGEDPHEAISRSRQEVARAEEQQGEFAILVRKWEEFLAREPLLYSIFSWLGPVRKKRLRLARLFLNTIWPGQIPEEEWQSVEQIETALQARLRRFNSALVEQRDRLTRGEDVLRLEQEQLTIWGLAVQPLDSNSDPGTLSLADCDLLADTSIRFRTFLCATHYWEGRWLLDMEKELPSLTEEKRKTGRQALTKRWLRRLKITPCVVSTFFMLPSEMKVRKRQDQDYVDDYLCNFVDLLIVDEAGQVSPDVAGASFALSKKALVIGDTLQLQPIWAIPTPVDIGNSRSAGLAVDAIGYEQFRETGKSAVGGSVMRVAQRLSRYHQENGLARGLFLLEHRRCFDEIIEYCNRLCYRGKLIPKRGSKGSSETSLDGFPAIGYLHVDGLCQRGNGGSRLNIHEAETVAAWLAEHRSELETKYKMPVQQIVGVLTPFGNQVGAISRACREVGIPVGNKNDELTVGTVHSLQGAQRRIVIFSPVYTKHADGAFIDENPGMLNVAVSRAQDAFLVFGDMDVWESVSKNTPRGLLAARLFQSSANVLRFTTLARKDLKRVRTSIRQLRDAEEHDAFLLEALSTVNREVQIITPWLRLERIKEIGALDAMISAVQRGIKVSVYTDPESNIDGNNPQTRLEHATRFENELRALTQENIEALLVGRVHSKAIIGDDSLYCVGSFNWFSANRDSRYAKHETSLVYQGTGLSNEISAMRESLRVRINNRGWQKSSGTRLPSSLGVSGERTRSQSTS